MDAQQLQRYFDHAIEASGQKGPTFTIVELTERQLRLRFDLGHQFTRPGGSITGPALFGMIDTVGWLMAVAHSGPGTDAFTTDVNVQYLRPVLAGQVELVGNLLRRGRRHVFDVSVDPGADGPAVHAVIAFATRPSEVLPG
ncbi:MAG: PaaI family thioesterase [Actinomycetota bacterium]|nr:PaaI family thioesterase [Actinomycetota bacterium]